MKWEEEQWKRESEMEERQRKQEQQHKMRMLEMLSRYMQPQYTHTVAVAHQLTPRIHTVDT